MKIKIKTILEENKKNILDLKNISGSKEENIIFYKENEYMEVKLTIEKNKITMNRKNKTREINLIYNPKEENLSQIKIDEELIIPLNIKTKSLEINENNIKIEYNIEENEYVYYIEFKEEK